MCVSAASLKCALLALRAFFFGREITLDSVEYDDLTRLLLASAATHSWPRGIQDVSIVKSSYISCLFIRVCRNMVFLCIVTDVRVARLELSNIGNYFCHEQDDTVSYCHDASYQAHLSADRGNLTEREQY